jgi:predicted  nucleic acid-binding Zn-ribbon protein
MSDLMDSLLALARCELAIEELRRAEVQLPRALQQAEAGAQAARDRIAAERRALEDAERLRRTTESELKDAEAKRGKFQAQTSMVKTNAEYTALLHEIDAAGERISALETQILESLEAIDAASRSIKVVDVEQRAVEQGRLHEAQALREKLAEVQKLLAEREAERGQLFGKLPADVRAKYTRVRDGTGSGTAQVAGRSCSRCHRDVPYETINRLSAGELHHCGNCGRLLVIAAS